MVGECRCLIFWCSRYTWRSCLRSITVQLEGASQLTRSRASYCLAQSKIKAGKAWVWCTYIGSIILVAAHVVDIALHFVFKKDVLMACEYDERIDYPGSSTQEIEDWCAKDWRNDIW